MKEAPVCEEVRYNEFRSEIKSGDILLFKGDDFLPRLIRVKSWASHAATVVKYNLPGMEDRIYLVEAIGKGLREVYASHRICKYNGEVYVLCLNSTKAQQEKMRAIGHHMACSELKYDFAGIFINAFGRVSMDVRRYFCSEFSYVIACESGYTESVGVAPIPGDLPAFLPQSTLYKLVNIPSAIL